MNTRTKHALSLTLLLAAAGLLSPRGARTQAVVYDNKQMPGAMCRITAANFDWIDRGLNTWQSRSSWVDPSSSQGVAELEEPAPFPGVPYTQDPQSPTAYYQAACPLIRDNPGSLLGITGIAVDVDHTSGANPPMSVECWERACSAPDSQGHVYCCKGAHAVLTASPTTEHYYAVPVPLVTSCNGSTNLSVLGGGVTCTVDVGTNILGVRWNERGANSSDW